MAQSYRRLLPAVAALSTPALCAFGVLLATGRIAPLPALCGALGTILLTAILLRSYGTDLTQLERYVRGLERGEDIPPPHLGTAIGTDILAVLNRLARSWRTRRDEMASLVGFHEALFDSLPNALFLLNGQRRILRANQAARTIFGDSVTDKDLAAILRNPPLLDAADKVLQGEPGGEVEFSAPVLERDFRAMVQPLQTQGSEVAKAVLALHDVTQLRRMEQMRADFVANASHELRTPLSALLSFIETLQGPAKDDVEARERFLAIMFEQASRMTRLVADLLNLSRIELNEYALPTGRADLPAILRRVVESLEPAARKRNMRLDLKIEEGLPVVNGKDDELAQIFLNLIDNALKYGREGTPVVIEARLAGPVRQQAANEKSVAVAVRDQGEGIAREHIPRLTERFFRVDTARSRRLGGTGLGLAIVKHIVNRHRGVLAIESTLGQGSTFTVTLPLAGLERTAVKSEGK